MQSMHLGTAAAAVAARDERLPGGHRVQRLNASKVRSSAGARPEPPAGDVAARLRLAARAQPTLQIPFAGALSRTAGAAYARPARPPQPGPVTGGPGNDTARKWPFTVGTVYLS